MNLQIVFNTPKNPCVNQDTQKNTLVQFSYPKHPGIEKFQTRKNPLIIPITWAMATILNIIVVKVQIGTKKATILLCSC